MELAGYRRAARKTQKQLAMEAGIARETLARIETGAQRPSPAVAERIAKALDMDIETMWRVMYRGEHLSSPDNATVAEIGPEDDGGRMDERG